MLNVSLLKTVDSMALIQSPQKLRSIYPAFKQTRGQMVEGKGKSVHQNQILTFHGFHFHFSLTSLELSLFQGLEDCHSPQPHSPATLVFHFKCQSPHQKRKGKKKQSAFGWRMELYLFKRSWLLTQNTARTGFWFSVSGQSPWIHFSILFLFHLTKPLHYGHKDGKDTTLILTRFKVPESHRSMQMVSRHHLFLLHFQKGHFQQMGEKNQNKALYYQIK